MSSSTTPCNTGKHGGSRSVLCWQDKLAQMGEGVILLFLSEFDCGCKALCGNKIRAMGETHAVEMIRNLRTARLSGYIINRHNMLHKPVCSDDALEGNSTAVLSHA